MSAPLHRAKARDEKNTVLTYIPTYLLTYIPTYLHTYICIYIYIYIAPTRSAPLHRAKATSIIISRLNY